MKNLILSAVVAASLSASNIDMVQGWNLVGFNTDVNISTSELVTGDVNTVWKYANQDWQLHTNNDIDTDIEIMTTIGRSEGVWVNAINNFTFEQSPEQNIESHTVNLTTGWNLVSTPFAMDINASEYFTAENVNTVWKYANGDWSLYSSTGIVTTITSFETINANQGYWVNAKNDFNVTFTNPNYVVEIPVVENNLTSNNTEETTTNIVIKYYIDNNNSVWLEKTTKGFIVKYDIETYENEEYLLVNSFYNDIDLANNAFGSDGFEIDTTALNGDETIEFKIATESMVVFNGTLDLSNYQAVEDNPVLENPVVENNTTEETVVENEVNTTTEDNTTEEEVTTVPTFILAKNIDTNDTDGDGMTDAAELKYGFDPYDASSFPNTDPEVIEKSQAERFYLDVNETIWLEETTRGIKVFWDENISNQYSYTAIYGDNLTDNVNILNNATGSGFAINYDSLNLTGTETISLSISGDDTTIFETTIDLNDYELVVVKAGEEGNRISYTFKDFTEENETIYREFLRKVWPIMYDRLGEPSENFNCVITNMGENSDYFMIVDQGRTFLTTQEFLPRLIVHEFVHAWKGRFLITSNKYWDFDPILSGFEEATAEGMAYEIVQEYVRTYPNDETSKMLVDFGMWWYHDAKSSHYDFVKTQRNTVSGDFWSGGVSTMTNRYQAASGTWATIVREYPNFYKDMMERIHEEINNDSEWRPNRDNIVAIWSEIAPTVLGIDMETYLDALPVFAGHNPEDGAYIMNETRHYGNGYGELQFALSYALNGNEWWQLNVEDLNNTEIPEGLKYVVNGEWVYSDQQGQKYTITVSTNDEVVKVAEDNAISEYSEDGRPLGMGWTIESEIDHTKFDLGLYKVNISFDDYTQFEGASETFYMLGYGSEEIVMPNTTLMVGLDIDAENLSTTVEIDGLTKTTTVVNDLSMFDMPEIEPGYEGTLNITVENDDQTCTYKRALLDTRTIWGLPEHGYVIIDIDFNCVEDIYEI